jgi:hypothetical protein
VNDVHVIKHIVLVHEDFLEQYMLHPEQGMLWGREGGGANKRRYIYLIYLLGFVFVFLSKN